MPELISSRALIRFPGRVASSPSTCERSTSRLEPTPSRACALRRCSRHTHLCAKPVCRARIARPPVLVCPSASLHAHPSSTPVACPPVSYDQRTVAPPPPGHNPWPLHVAPLAFAARPSVSSQKLSVSLLSSIRNSHLHLLLLRPAPTRVRVHPWPVHCACDATAPARLPHCLASRVLASPARDAPLSDFASGLRHCRPCPSRSAPMRPPISLVAPAPLAPARLLVACLRNAPPA
jgi:hypothetical protein